MSWERKSFDEIGFIGRGKSRHRPRNAEHLYGGEYPFVQTGDIKAANFRINEYTQTYNEAGLAQSKLWKEGTLCITIAANIADTAILGIDACFPDSVIGFVPYEDKSDVRFVKYFFDIFQARMKSIAVGAAQDNLSLEKLLTFKIPIPPLPTQRRIASILSAYDDLIENNLKRIKLLEEKAQLHYKELMQEMSYSKTKREEFIKTCLAFYIGGGWGEEDYKEGFTEPAYVIRGTDIPDTRGGNVSGIPLRFHKVSNLESRKMQVGDIVFEISNGQINNIGRTVLISKRLLGQFDQPVMCASFAKLIRVNEKVSPEFFYLYLNEGQENGLLYQYKSNSANGINNFAFETFIDEVKITIPKETELKAFTEKVKPIFTLISTLGEQNSKLREARDILLPKLMNGQIEV
ncbi:MAG: restriction endonuclease subunit S [Bacteroidia bacterium]|nr:restriction endonuclease subunit S [Bacteroidia bacterium]